MYIHTSSNATQEGTTPALHVTAGRASNPAPTADPATSRAWLAILRALLMASVLEYVSGGT